MTSVDNFEKQIDNVVYKGETYSVRDNGAVMRHEKSCKKRSIDLVWTFGKQNSITGYMEISGERVHRIVATGFLGNAPSKDHIVDHIDTNRCNNRIENLRWITKLENVLLNPITQKKISLVCGSVEEFLKDPAKYRDKFLEPNVSWMCSVSKEEAKNTLDHFRKWVNDRTEHVSNGNIGEWIYQPVNNENIQRTSYFDNIKFNDGNDNSPWLKSQNDNALQNWRTPTEFCCLPKSNDNEPIVSYFNSLKENEVMSKNQYAEYKVEKKIIYCDSIILITSDEKGIKPWAVLKITFDNGIFYHSLIQTCFSYEGAEKTFTIMQGLEWNGPDSIDDYC